MNRNSHIILSLPNPNLLKNLCQSFAALEAAIETEWHLRYFSFNFFWSKTESMASMRDGSGDDLFIVFSGDNCFLRGSSLSCEMTPKNGVWEGILTGVPSEFLDQLEEPAFHMADTTFCGWYLRSIGSWQVGKIELPLNSQDPDGSKRILSYFISGREGILKHLATYHELKIEPELVDSFLGHFPISKNSFLQNKEFHGDWPKFVEDANEIGYPISEF
jgi:hypothetical protein